MTAATATLRNALIDFFANVRAQIATVFTVRLVSDEEAFDSNDVPVAANTTSHLICDGPGYMTSERVVAWRS